MENRSAKVEHHLKNWESEEVVCGSQSDGSSCGVFVAMVSNHNYRAVYGVFIAKLKTCGAGGKRVAVIQIGVGLCTHCTSLSTDKPSD